MHSCILFFLSTVKLCYLGEVLVLVSYKTLSTSENVEHFLLLESVSNTTTFYKPNP